MCKPELAWYTFLVVCIMYGFFSTLSFEVHMDIILYVFMS